MKLFYVCKKPLLLHCSHYAEHIKLIEGVHQCATKLIDLHYDERVKQLGLMRLDVRRNRNNLI